MTLDWNAVLVACIHAGPPTVAVIVTWRHQGKKLHRIERASNGQLAAKDERIKELETENAHLRRKR